MSYYLRSLRAAGGLEFQLALPTLSLSLRFLIDVALAGWGKIFPRLPRPILFMQSGQ